MRKQSKTKSKRAKEKREQAKEEIEFLRKLYRETSRLEYLNDHTKKMDLYSLQEEINSLVQTRDQYWELVKSLNFVKRFLNT
jgi:thiamine biosynthesis lipoprotein ApbE